MWGKNLLSGAVAGLGNYLKLPEFGISERIKSSAKPTPVKQVAGPQAPAVMPTGISPNYGSGGSSSGGTYTPASVGQSAGGGGGSEQATEGPDTGYLDRIRSEFGNVRGSYENQINSYDTDYNLAKGNTESAITRAKDTLTEQKGDEDRRFGENLRSLLQTDKELRDRRTGTFSALGTLDSSAFQQDVEKGDQNLVDNKTKLEGERDRVIRGKEKEYSTYENDATSKLASYANDIARAKEGLKQAIAETNMSEASSILTYMDQIKQRAQAVQDQREAMKLNLMQLQAQGVDVIGNIGKVNSTEFSNAFGNNLKGAIASAGTRYAIPDSSASGSGYINPSTGKPYSEDEKRMLRMA